MSRKPESTFISSVHRHIPATLYRMKNNNPFTGGVPDCWYSGAKTDLWVEYKFLSRIPRTPFSLDLSALQRDWLSGRYLEGRNVAVIIGCATGGVIFEHLSWMADVEPREYERLIQSRAELATWIMDYVGAPP